VGEWGRRGREARQAEDRLKAEAVLTNTDEMAAEGGQIVCELRECKGE
jgi:hypothetical protein